MTYQRLALAASFLLACGKIDPDAVDSNQSKATAEAPSSSNTNTPGHAPPGDLPGKAASASSSSSGTLALAPARCATTNPADRIDFEEGVLAADLEVTNANALSIDTAQPISGTASLRVAAGNAFVRHEVTGTCIHLEFTVRASAGYVTNAGALARIDAGSRRYTIWSSGTDLALMRDEVYAGRMQNAGSRGFGAEDKILPDVPTTLIVDFDTTTATITTSVRTAEGDGPSVTADFLPTDGVPPSSLVAVEFGSIPDVVKDTQGGPFWIDDILVYH